MSPADIARFWSHVEVRGPRECWPWTGGTSSRGYGRFSVGGRLHTASRVAYELHHGPLGAAEARHTCDNPPCCNPTHLIPGTHEQNMGDMAVRGRVATRKLTVEQVRDIRARHAAVGTNALAREHGVTPSNVSQIVHRRTWRHVEGAAA